MNDSDDICPFQPTYVFDEFLQNWTAEGMALEDSCLDEFI
jgi:hypothetical protein